MVTGPPVPVLQGSEWLSWRTGAQAEKHATMLLFPKVALVYIRKKNNKQIKKSHPCVSTVQVQSHTRVSGLVSVPHRIECELQVERSPGGLRGQRVGEQRRVRFCDADVGAVDGGVPQGENVQLLVEHGDAPHARGCRRSRRRAVPRRRGVGDAALAE